MSTPTLSVIIPMYNEAPIIFQTISDLDSFLSEHFDNYELILVNDGSKDYTDEIVQEAVSDKTNIKLISYPDNRGKGYAVKTGMLAATGEIRIFTDSDLAFGVDIIRQFYDALSHSRVDVAIGSRAIQPNGYEGYTITRKIASKTYIKILNIVGGLKQTDSQTGIKGFKADAVERIFSKMETDGFAFDFEVLMLAKKAGLKIMEIPVQIINHRKSSVHILSDSVKMMKEVLRIKKRVKKYEV